jgi:formimidoylglutamate deiminase
VEGTWAKDVLLGVGVDGHWSQVLPGATDAQRVDAVVLSGPVLPGVVNAHGHAFQRAIAGLT